MTYQMGDNQDKLYGNPVTSAHDVEGEFREQVTKFQQGTNDQLWSEPPKHATAEKNAKSSLQMGDNQEPESETGARQFDTVGTSTMQMG